jgi:hypothetical protein
MPTLSICAILVGSVFHLTTERTVRFIGGLLLIIGGVYPLLINLSQSKYIAAFLTILIMILGIFSVWKNRPIKNN